MKNLQVSTGKTAPNKRKQPNENAHRKAFKQVMKENDNLMQKLSKR